MISNWFWKVFVWSLSPHSPCHCQQIVILELWKYSCINAHAFSQFLNVGYTRVVWACPVASTLSSLNADFPLNLDRWLCQCQCTHRSRVPNVQWIVRWSVYKKSHRVWQNILECQTRKGKAWNVKAHTQRGRSYAEIDQWLVRFFYV